MKKIFCITILVCIGGTSNVNAQMSISSFKSDVSKVGTTAAPFLTIGVGARANALGGAFVYVANDVTATDSGFGTDTNRVIIIDRKGKIDRLPLLAKRQVAERILDKVGALLARPKSRLSKKP